MRLVAFTDGSIQGGNPGGHAVGGWALFSEEANKSYVLSVGCHDLGKGPDRTNNQAEYAGVWACLKHVTSQYPVCEELVMYSDSKLIVNQLRGLWMCGKQLESWRDRCLEEIDKLKTVTFEWIPRSQNTCADQVSRYLYLEKSKLFSDFNVIITCENF